MLWLRFCWRPQRPYDAPDTGDHAHQHTDTAQCGVEEKERTSIFIGRRGDRTPEAKSRAAPNCFRKNKEWCLRAFLIKQQTSISTWTMRHSMKIRLHYSRRGRDGQFELMMSLRGQLSSLPINRTNNCFSHGSCLGLHSLWWNIESPDALKRMPWRRPVLWLPRPSDPICENTTQ